MSPYAFLLHHDSFRRLQDYRVQLTVQGLATAGGRLRAALHGQDLGTLDDEAFLEHLINTKSPRIFAESAVHGDGRDWNLTELGLLGDLGLAVPVRIFDDGRHGIPQVHEEPLSGTLLFTPGALLRNNQGGVAGDWATVTQGGRIDSAGYRNLYERRLLPLLLHIDTQAAATGRRALVTLPGLGCGQFAGPFQGSMGLHLKDALLTPSAGTPRACGRSASSISTPSTSAPTNATTSMASPCGSGPSPRATITGHNSASPRPTPRRARTSARSISTAWWPGTRCPGRAMTSGAGPGPPMMASRRRRPMSCAP